MKRRLLVDENPDAFEVRGFYEVYGRDDGIVYARFLDLEDARKFVRLS